jgi:hypothetical protein
VPCSRLKALTQPEKGSAVKTLGIICIALFWTLGCFVNAFSADGACDVDRYIQQTAKRCYEVQQTIDGVSRFLADNKKNTRIYVDRWGAELLEEFYQILCVMRDILENENKTLYLYKHIDANHRATVSRFLTEEFTSKIETSFQTRMKRAKNSLETYRKGEVDVNVVQLAEQMVDQTALSAKLLFGIKKFYIHENKIAKGKN